MHPPPHSLPPLLLLLLLLPAALSQPSPTPLTTPCPVVLPTTTRIVGGTLASSEHMVFLRTPTGLCSGTLITRRHVLTAAHCGIDPRTTAFVSSTDGADGTVVPILRAVAHPRDDIALVTLARPAPARPVRVLANAALPSAWSFVRAQGYGIQSGLPFPSDTRQRFVDFPVVPTQLCEEIASENLVEDGSTLGDDPAFPDDYICTGYLQSTSCSVCSGDSGGAVFALRDEDPVLIGVISRGDALCSLPGRAGISVRVSSYIDWLDELDVEYNPVTELTEVFVDSEGVTVNNGSDNSLSRLPPSTGQDAQPALAPGAIAGIAVGAAAVVLLAALAAAFLLKRSKRDGSEPPADAGESEHPPVASGSSLVPPTHSAPVQHPTTPPPPAPAYATAQGKFVELAQPDHHPPQPMQQTTPGAYPMPTAPPPMQAVPETGPPPAQQASSAIYPMPTPPPPTQPPMQPPPQTASAVDTTPPMTQPPTQPR